MHQQHLAENMHMLSTLHAISQRQNKPHG